MDHFNYTYVLTNKTSLMQVYKLIHKEFKSDTGLFSKRIISYYPNVAGPRHPNFHLGLILISVSQLTFEQAQTIDPVGNKNK